MGNYCRNPLFRKPCFSAAPHCYCCVIIKNMTQTWTCGLGFKNNNLPPSNPCIILFVIRSCVHFLTLFSLPHGTCRCERFPCLPFIYSFIEAADNNETALIVTLVFHEIRELLYKASICRHCQSTRAFYAEVMCQLLTLHWLQWHFTWSIG